jgi:hypothetical protein
MICCPPPTIEDKTERPQFDTIMLIKAESQTVLNTQTKHSFQDAYKKMAKTQGTVHTHERELLQAPVPEIMGGPLYTLQPTQLKKILKLDSHYDYHKRLSKRVNKHF